jgi:hypothetical protein
MPPWDYTPSGGNPKDWSESAAANVVAFVRKTVESLITVHHGHMPEVEVLSPTTASAIFAMEDLIWWPEGSRRKTLHGWGHYHETYEKVEGKWLIKTLKFNSPSRGRGVKNRTTANLLYCLRKAKDSQTVAKETLGVAASWTNQLQWRKRYEEPGWRPHCCSVSSLC